MDKFKGFCLFLSFLSVFQAKADVWDTPKTKFYYSENKVFVLKVVPTYIPEKYYEWRFAKQSKKKKFSQSDTTIVHGYAVLFKIIVNDSNIIWKRQLINRICPVSACVSNDGKHVITCDNWYNMGYGDDVLVIYNEFGDLTKRYKLEDISPFPINDYEMSITSLHWNCGNKFLDNEKFEICFYVEKVNKNRVFNVYEMKFEN
jgi:hypothetical protein